MYVFFSYNRSSWNLLLTFLHSYIMILASTLSSPIADLLPFQFIASTVHFLLLSLTPTNPTFLFRPHRILPSVQPDPREPSLVHQQQHCWFVRDPGRCQSGESGADRGGAHAKQWSEWRRWGKGFASGDVARQSRVRQFVCKINVYLVQYLYLVFVGKILLFSIYFLNIIWHDLR